MNNGWQRLLRQASVDVLCAQESRAPIEYFDGEALAGSAVFNPAHDRDWGSAIWSRHHALEEISLDAFRGHVVAARANDVKLGGRSWNVDFVSVHIPEPAPYVRQVAHLIDLLVQRPRDALLFLAGDFNITTALRHVTEVLETPADELAVLTRLRRELGVVNAWQLLHPNQPLPQTLRWTKSPTTPYHCDAIYVDCRALQYLETVEILQDKDWSRLTDHSPIVVNLQD